MRILRYLVTVFLGVACVMLLFSCQQEEIVQADETQAEISEVDLDADIPALHNLHGVVYPLWHDAYPEKDYALIKELIPEADALTQRLDEAELPGILRDKKPEWEKAKENLKMSLQALHDAVDEDDQKAMLDQVEVFHAAFERLARIIRPVVPELDAFHREMYKLYHYYLPNYDLENIRLTVDAMQEKLLPLKAVQLPQRLAEKQEQFDAAVQELESFLGDLAKDVNTGDKNSIEESVEKVHTAYQKTETVFD